MFYNHYSYEMIIFKFKIFRKIAFLNLLYFKNINSIFCYQCRKNMAFFYGVVFNICKFLYYISMNMLHYIHNYQEVQK